MYLQSAIYRYIVFIISSFILNNKNIKELLFSLFVCFNYFEMYCIDNFFLSRSVIETNSTMHDSNLYKYINIPYTLREYNNNQ